MRFTKAAALLALPLLAVATKTTVSATPQPTSTQPASQCNTGSIQCCDSVQKASSPSSSLLLGLLGIVVQGANVLIGLDCSPISVIGAGGNSCSANPVCCENNSFKGLVAVGCVPVNLSL